jgi:hypothetical protein
MNNIVRKTPVRVVVLSLLFIASGNIAATTAPIEEKDNNKNPLGCRNVGYQFDMKTVHLLPTEFGHKQSMYFLFNKLGQKVTLYQMRDEDSSRSMYLNHVINAGQWAVLSTSEPKVKYICTVPDNKLPHGQIVDCGESLKVCEYTNVKFGMNNRGNYWLVNSNTRGGALQEVLRYGIIPAI